MKYAVSGLAVLAAFSLFGFSLATAQAADSAVVAFRSHSPMRPLPVVSSRDKSDGPSYFVDQARGDDTADGSEQRPWKTIGFGVARLRPGDTLYLRGGTYYEHVRVASRGRADKPITLRSYPGEMVILDGGLREFYEAPQESWQPSSDGVAGEFISTKTYSDLGGVPGGTNVLGNFGDSMIPLHGYRFLSDLRSDNEYLDKLGAGKTEEGSGVYCGPGIFYDTESARIHVRLAHTAQRALGQDNYRGETDPRRLPLVIAGASAGPALTLEGASHVRIQDLVVRGARTASVAVHDSQRIEFDGVTMYGGAAPIEVRRTAGLRLWNCACRGIAAPWTFRGSLKYRAIEARLFSASGWSPDARENRDFELAYSEFTDCVDGVFIGNVNHVHFHHNLLDNVSDDGFFVTATTAYDGTTPGGNIHIYQNLLSRCLTTFAFGVGHGRQKMTATGRQTGHGVYIYRNVFDLRQPVHYQQPGEGEPEVTTYGRVAGDHGGPLWEPMWIYHNTILLREPPFRSYYAAGLGGHLAGGSKRRVFNNITIQETGKPGFVLPPAVPFPSAEELAVAAKAQTKKGKKRESLDDLLDRKPIGGANNKVVEAATAELPLPIDFQADANLHWSYEVESSQEELFGRFLRSADFPKSQRLYSPGWIVNDLVADPAFMDFGAKRPAPLDLRLSDDSPAVNAGVKLPEAWPDPLAAQDTGSPDLGAVPRGAGPWAVGVAGRLNVFGTATNSGEFRQPVDRAVAFESLPAVEPPAASSYPQKPVMIVNGYPAFDSPLIEHALQQRGLAVASIERTWLPAERYADYRAVVVVGSLTRAQIEPNKFTASDLQHVRQFLESGGTLCLMRGNQWVFRTADGERFLHELTGGAKGREKGFEILLPRHPWVNHLPSDRHHDWVNIGHAEAIGASRGELIIGNKAGLATLYRVPVGRGELIYVGWDIAASLPHGRKPSTVEQEQAYEAQMHVLAKIVESF